MMGFAANAFHWTAAAFWQSTPHEYWAAYEMWRRFNPPRDDAAN
jgi:hypothetical protein